MTLPQREKRECVVLFARSAGDEASAKRIARSRRLFERSQHRIAEAVGSLAGVDLILSFEDSRDPCGETTAIRQRGNGFGQRFHNAMSDVASLGYGNIVAIPIDVPELSVSQLRRAFLSLRESPFVLGPSPDGGVYLIGFRAEEMPRLEDIAWHSERVFDQLAQAMPHASVIEKLTDIDDTNDVRALMSRRRLDPQLKALLWSILNPPSTGVERPRHLHSCLSLPPLPARAPPVN